MEEKSKIENQFPYRLYHVFHVRQKLIMYKTLSSAVCSGTCFLLFPIFLAEFIGFMYSRHMTDVDLSCEEKCKSSKTVSYIFFRVQHCCIRS